MHNFVFSSSEIKDSWKKKQIKTEFPLSKYFQNINV